MKTVSSITEVKQHNLSLVRNALKSISGGTKNTVAAMTGLSVATCNTILNELAASGEILEAPSEDTVIGRPPKKYSYNASFAYVLCVFVNRENNVSVNSAVTDLLGRIVSERSCACCGLSVDDLLYYIGQELEKEPGIRYISLGLPGYISGGTVISTGGLPGLEGQPVPDRIREHFGLPVTFENDTNAIAEGLYTYGDPGIAGKDLAVAAFFRDHQPGCGIIVKGEILEGSTGFAGEASHLIYRSDMLNNLPEVLDSAYVRESAVTIVTALICIVNPEIIIFTGEGIDETILQAVREEVSERIPREHLPVLLYGSDIRRYYFWGLLAKAVKEAF